MTMTRSPLRESTVPGQFVVYYLQKTRLLMCTSHRDINSRSLASLPMVTKRKLVKLDDQKLKALMFFY
jgi:hypothetical protein